MCNFIIVIEDGLLIGDGLLLYKNGIINIP